MEVLMRKGAAGHTHQWLWQVRLQQAYAEIACAAGDWRKALKYAEAAITQSRARGRVKYLVMGLETRARALVGLERKVEAIENLQPAVQSARTMGDPALFLRAATTLLAAS